MPFKIRTKLIVAFLGLTLVLLSATGIVGYYNQMASREAFQEVEEITKEIRITGDMQLIFERILMPANDYIITGNRKYLDDFKKDAKELETLLKEAEAIIVRMEKVTPEFTAEEKKILSDINVAWRNIKDISNRIFAISNPVGNMEAVRLMEEMDYTWGKPAVDGVHKWHEGDYREYEEAVESARSVWLRLWIIMGVSAVMLIFLGIAFAVFYSGLFVKPIEAIHTGADAIAAGNFKTRLDIKTGDEIEQLSNAMNEMAEKLDSFYGTLERQVEERTRELQESEDRYRVLGKTAPNAMICLKAPDTVIFWNRRATEIFGYSEEEVIGKPMHGLIVPEKYREKAGEGMKRFFQTGTGAVVGKKTELSALRRDGSEFPIELSLSAMNIRGEWQATGIVRDITDRKQAEEALRHERDMAQAYLDVAGVMFIVIDPSEKVVLANKRGAEVLGCSEGDIIGKNWFDEFLPERVRDEIRGVFRRLIKGEDGVLEYVENPVLTCSGEERLIAWHNAALKDETGKIIAILSSGEDITERKMFEDGIWESEKRYHDLIENIPDVAYIGDKEGNTIFISGVVEKVYGFTPDELYNGGSDMWLGRIHPDDLERVKRSYETFFNEGEKFDIEYRIRRKDEKWIWLHDRLITSIKKEDVILIYGLFSDISLRKETEEKLKQRIDDLEMFRKITIKRELRMEELQRKVDELETKLKSQRDK